MLNLFYLCNIQISVNYKKSRGIQCTRDFLTLTYLERLGLIQIKLLVVFLFYFFKVRIHNIVFRCSGC